MVNSVLPIYVREQPGSLQPRRPNVNETYTQREIPARSFSIAVGTFRMGVWEPSPQQWELSTLWWVLSASATHTGARV
jgi:hypothetical protein